ncbi:sensor domain-containing diguanylate cyclase [Psychromonas aquimarina]|uniref:sensor domain-containing diguanylate cyclase n=1 Tax=Psychromonas aquimarina TaxID=444919 RepID=UPI0004906C3D|nr:cache domain-containing protein [Psychromonas aquimarina]
MDKIKNKSLLARFTAVILLLIIASSVSISFYYIEMIKADHRTQIDELRNAQLLTAKTHVKDQVEELIDFIAFQRYSNRNRVKADLQEHVEQALLIAENIYYQNRADSSLEEIKQSVINALAPVRGGSDQQRYYFIYNSDGSPVLDISISGKSGQKSEFSQALRKKMTTAVKQQGRVLMQENLTAADLSRQPALIFIKQFKALGWYIGSFEYESDIEQRTKQSILDKINFKRESSDYIFVFDNQGKFIAHPELTGMQHRNISEFSDISGNKLLNSINKVINEQYGGFVQYSWMNPVTDKVSTKTSYVQSFSPWGWTVGAGTYIDEVDSYIADFESEMDKSLHRIMLGVMTITMLLLAVFLMVGLGFKNSLERDMQRFIHLFKLASTKNKLIVKDSLKYSEFITLAHYANNILEAQIEAQNELIEHATVDSLTKAFNRRQFMSLFRLDYQKAVESKNDLVLMLLDIDFFKLVNDNYGHPCGDLVLQKFVNICKSQVRKSDYLGRVGGEEFALLLPDTNIDEALMIAEKLRQTIENAVFTCKECSLSITVSIGLSSIIDQPYHDESSMFKQADAYLYQAKDSGRNQVCSRLS